MSTSFTIRSDCPAGPGEETGGDGRGGECECLCGEGVWLTWNVLQDNPMVNVFMDVGMHLTNLHHIQEEE